MKKFLAIVLIAASCATACNKSGNVAKFIVTDKADLIIEAEVATVGTFDLYSLPVYSEASRELTFNNSKVDMVESVTLEELRMVISRPFGESWNFLKDIEVYIDADQLPEQKIAFEADITDLVKGTLLLKPVDGQLSEYLKKGTYILKVRFTTDKQLANDLDVSITTKYAVQAKTTGS